MYRVTKIISILLLFLPVFCYGQGKGEEKPPPSMGFCLHGNIDELGYKGYSADMSYNGDFGRLDVNLFNSEDSSYEADFRFSKDLGNKELFVGTALMNRTFYLKDSFLFRAGLNTEGKLLLNDKVKVVNSLMFGYFDLPHSYMDPESTRMGMGLVNVKNAFISVPEDTDKKTEFTRNICMEAQAVLPVGDMISKGIEGFEDSYMEVLAFSDVFFHWNYSIVRKLIGDKLKAGIIYKGSLGEKMLMMMSGFPVNHGLIGSLELAPIDNLNINVFYNYPITVYEQSTVDQDRSFMNHTFGESITYDVLKGWQLGLVSAYNYYFRDIDRLTAYLSRVSEGYQVNLYYRYDTRPQNSYAGLTVNIGLRPADKETPSDYYLKRYGEYSKLDSYEDHDNYNLGYMEDYDFEDAIDELDTPDEIVEFTDQYFEYDVHDRGIPKAPEEIYYSRRGHCVDQMRFQAYCLKRHGYEAYVVQYFANGSAHAICIFRDKDTNKWDVLEYNNYNHIQAENIEEVILNWRSPGAYEFHVANPEDFSLVKWVYSRTSQEVFNWFRKR